MTSEQHDQKPQWHVDKSINLPSVFSVVVIGLTGLWWLSQLQFQTNANTAELVAWKITWTQFTSAREVVVRTYEQRMAQVESRNDEIIRRLTEIREEQRLVAARLLEQGQQRRSPQ